MTIPLNMPLRVGLTGGIGSGKSVAAEMFAELGVPVIDADIVAREVVEPGEPALISIAEHFGRDILLPDGGLDRARLREIIFKDQGEKKWLEELLHPLIRERIVQQMSRQSAPYLLLVSPLLIESGQNRLVEQVIVVDVSEQIQMERTLNRDGVSREQVVRILSSQLPREERRAHADYLLDNGGDLAALREQVKSVHQQLMAKVGEAVTGENNDENH